MVLWNGVSLQKYKAHTLEEHQLSGNTEPSVPWLPTPEVTTAFQWKDRFFHVHLHQLTTFMSILLIQPMHACSHCPTSAAPFPSPYCHLRFPENMDHAVCPHEMSVSCKIHLLFDYSLLNGKQMGVVRHCLEARLSERSGWMEVVVHHLEQGTKCTPWEL